MGEWREVRLGDLVHVTHGWPFRSSEYSRDPAQPVVVAIGNFDYTGGFRFESSIVKHYSGEYPRGFEFAPGDIAMVMTCQTEGGEILGVPAIVPDDGRIYLHNQRIGRVRVDRPDLLDTRFLFHFARWSEFNRQLFETASGSKILHTSPSRIAAVRLSLPPLEEQRAIADVLGALDDKIAANTRIADTSHQLATALYTRATTGRAKVPMSSRLTPVLGATPARVREEYWEGDVAWVSARDVTNAPQGIILETTESITEQATRETRARTVPAGSVILTARGTVGAVARLGVPAAFNQSCYAFEPGDIPSGVLTLTIQASVESARALSHGSVFDTITMSTFDKVLIPNLDSQESEALENAVGPLLGRAERAVRENIALASTRDTLLPALMSGKLRVRDAQSIVGDVT